MVRPDFPRNILEFQSRFSDEQACLDYLIECRWPEGYVCPRCAGRSAWPVGTRRLWECSSCRYQVSIIAGTVLHKTHTALHLWFWAAYLMVTGTPRISARQLQRQLGLTRYESVWTMLHKLRRTMVNPERTPLVVEVEVDKFEIGGHEPGRRGGRNLTAKAVQVVVAVEVRGQGSGRVRMRIIPDASGDTLGTLGTLVKETIAPGAIVHTNGWMGYAPLVKAGYRHRPRSQRAAKRGGDADPTLPRVHRAISNLKSWLRGTHRSVGNEHLQVYLDEFTFRYNRRATPMAAFQSLLGLGAQQAPATYRQIVTHGSRPEPTT